MKCRQFPLDRSEIQRVRFVGLSASGGWKISVRMNCSRSVGGRSHADSAFAVTFGPPAEAPVEVSPSDEESERASDTRWASIVRASIAEIVATGCGASTVRGGGNVTMRAGGGGAG